jgi:death on curing protein
MNYIDIDRAKSIHRETIKVSGGGEEGYINLGALESVLIHIQNDDYYPTLEEKLNHLVFSVNKRHCFIDGNKRLSITLGADFLLINGYFKIVGKFIVEMENISYHVASGKISKELLQKIVTSLISEIDFSENLKLEIFIAINDDRENEHN